MSDDREDDPAGAERSTPAPSVTDERDAAIEHLERELAEERQRATTLLETIEKMRFQLDVLERSYSKQLADARLRSETAERELAEQQTRMTALESAHEEAMQSLTAARAEVERLTADRGQLGRALAATDRLRLETVAPGDAELRVRDSARTIDELMDDLRWLREREPADDEEATPHPEPESPSEDMISPELVFPGKSDDEGV